MKISRQRRSRTFRVASETVRTSGRTSRSLAPTTHVLNNMLSIASSSLSFLPPSSLVASSSKAAHIQMKASEFAYGLPGGDNILGEFDPAGLYAVQGSNPSLAD